MNLRHGMAALMISVALFGLSACENSKDKAARHLASALELAEKGDGERAVVEFRNVFKLDPENLEARRAFAEFLKERGDLPGAYAQYQALIDRNPGDEPALRGAAQIATDLGNWPDAGRHADAVLALVPDDPAMLAVRTGFDYAQAFSSGDTAGRAEAAAQAKRLLEGQPENLLLHRIVIDDLAQNGQTDAALTAADAALKLFPQELGLYQLRVSLLAAKDDKPAVEAALIRMEELFPDDPTIGDALLRWYIGNDQLDQAEAWLRAKAQGTEPIALEARVGLIAFLQKYRSPQAALDEIAKALAEMPPAPAEGAEGADTASITPASLRALRASILFDQGEREAALAEMKDILTTAQPSDQTRQIKVTLARMYLTTGDVVQSRALVEEILVEEAGNAEALKMKAAWLIEDDKVDEAIALLRTALDGAPRDAQAMGLMADAYGRAGSRDLQADMLAQAVAASGKAPGETLRYARFLAGDQKFLPAETILVDALRLNPENLDLLSAMGDLYIAMKDWPRAEGVAQRLSEIATPAAIEIANRLTPAILANRDDVGAAVDYLAGLAKGSDDLSAKATLLSAYLANGQYDEAKTLAEDMAAAAPTEAGPRFAVAVVKGAMGDGAGARADYRTLVTEFPQRADIWIALVRQTSQDESQAAAEAVVDEGLVAIPDQGDLLLMKANLQELRQDIDGAIATYEKLYETNSENLIVANNMASLLSTYRNDPASLDRAWAVARRLNGTSEPAFADTYGWLAHLRGQTSEALPYLETAAKALESDPVVQFHLAEIYKALNRPDEAKAQYAKVLALVPADDSRAFVATARKEAGQ